MLPNAVVITGPTATGKTALGVELALRLDGEVISADSMQLYRGMDIGTAKPTQEEMRGVAHHLIDCAEPGESWSVSRWTEEAARLCDEITARGRLPIIVGGTGLYIDSLLSGRDFAQSGDPECRRELSERYDELGGEAMLRELSQFDPQRAAKLAPADKKRIVRAYEVFLLTGVTITEHDEETKKRPKRLNAVIFALDYAQRDDLYRRIDERVDAMTEAGLFDEVRALLKAGLSPDSTAMQAIGYKETAAALSGSITPAEASELIKRESRRYAKRQLTWLRRDPEVRWIRWEGQPDIQSAADSVEAVIRSVFCAHTP